MEYKDNYKSLVIVLNRILNIKNNWAVYQYLGFISDLWSIITVYNCSARVKIQSLNLEG